MATAVQRTDYDRLWSKQLKEFDHGRDGAAYWNRRSLTFDHGCQNSTYAQDLMSRMDLHPECSVLDVGCGCGAVAIPLARRVNRVTALDIAPIMLEKLRHRAAVAGLTNITTVNQDWNQVAIGRGIEQHNIVLLSRCVLAPLSQALHRINEAAVSACYVVWRAERSDGYEAEVAEAMGKEPSIYPDYSAICGILRCMGISASIEVFESTNHEEYATLEEAVLSIAKGAEIDDGQFARLLAVARNRLTKANGLYSSVHKAEWALVSWKK